MTKIIEKPIRRKNYFTNQNVKKDTILLHHTVSGNAMSPWNWFDRKENRSKVSTAFILDKDGTIYQLFDPKFSSYHTGTGNRNHIDFRSVAIEIVNEGWLTKKENEFYWLGGKIKYNGKVYESENHWRGFRYFASYTEKQYESLDFLIKHLFNIFPDIEKSFSNTLEYDEKFFTQKGIISHTNVRKDKTDLSIAFNLSKIENLVKSFEEDVKINTEGLKINPLEHII